MRASLLDRRRERGQKENFKAEMWEPVYNIKEQVNTVWKKVPNSMEMDGPALSNEKV